MNIITFPCQCGGQFLFSAFSHKDGPCAIGKCDTCNENVVVSLNDIIEQLQIGFHVKKPKGKK